MVALIAFRWLRRKGRDLIVGQPRPGGRDGDSA